MEHIEKIAFSGKTPSTKRTGYFEILCNQSMVKNESVFCGGIFLVLAGCQGRQPTQMTVRPSSVGRGPGLEGLAWRPSFLCCQSCVKAVFEGYNYCKGRLCRFSWNSFSSRSCPSPLQIGDRDVLFTIWDNWIFMKKRIHLEPYPTFLCYINSKLKQNK